MALDWTKKDPRFIYFYQENKGLSEARNAGIRKAKGEYLLPLDSDDLIHKNYLIEAVPIILSDNNIKIVYTDTRLFGISRAIWNYAFDWNNFLFQNYIPCTALYRKKDWKNAGGYNPNMKGGFEDWDFWMSIIEKGGKVYRIKKPLFFYRQRENSMIGKLTSEDYIRLKRTLALNHLRFYADKLGDPLTLTLKIKDLERQKKLMENSLAYRIGALLTKPFKLLKDLLKKVRKK